MGGSPARMARRKPKGVHEYARHIARISCAQLVLAQDQQMRGDGGSGTDAGEAPLEGLEGVNMSVLETMADLLEAYIVQLARRAASYANLSGRSVANANDVLVAIADSASVTSTDVRDLCLYAAYEEVPFPKKIHGAEQTSLTAVASPSSSSRLPLCQPTPAITLTRKDKDPLSERLKRALLRDSMSGAPPTTGAGVGAGAQAQNGGTSTHQLNERSGMPGEGPHLEPWMPALPPQHCYIESAMFARSGDRFDPDARPVIDVAEASHQKRQAEHALIKFASSSKRSRGAVGVDENPFWVPSRVLDLHEEVRDAHRDRPENIELSRSTAVFEKQGAAYRPDQGDARAIQAERILKESAGIHERE
ncbi:hypothetical protein FVE85_5666 [Porphyridium purpureum]|uniref:Transcription initiation factor TFIID subunit 8 n=1 Tax=Porphyridium purpureum TaxID=35688 RepID=A0A5J4Z2K8_PORPP|nr:hypothetical protein FVE85_5666 [Porphyridium purpureum]|eukprot:POR5881..scf295_1